MKVCLGVRGLISRTHPPRSPSPLLCLLPGVLLFLPPRLERSLELLGPLCLGHDEASARVAEEDGPSSNGVPGRDPRGVDSAPWARTPMEIAAPPRET